jgi:hypothetical protein
VLRRLVCFVALAASSLVGLAAFGPSSTLPSAAAAAVPVISPTSGPPGTLISVTVPGCTGFVVAAFASVTARTSADTLASSESPGDHTTLTVPAGTAPGAYIVAAGCDVYNVNGFSIVDFTVSPAAVVAQPHLTG